MVMNPFRRKPAQAQPQVPAQRMFTQEEVMALLAQQQQQRQPRGSRFPDMELTKDERYMCKILDANVPESAETEDLYLFAGKASTHVALTNIFDPYVYQRLRRRGIDLMRIRRWGNKYFRERQYGTLYELNLLKSVSFSRSSREREQLNETRTNMTIRDDRALQPRESHSMVGGWLGGGR